MSVTSYIVYFQRETFIKKFQARIRVNSGKDIYENGTVTKTEKHKERKKEKLVI